MLCICFSPSACYCPAPFALTALPSIEWHFSTLQPKPVSSILCRFSVAFLRCSPSSHHEAVRRVNIIGPWPPRPLLSHEVALRFLSIIDNRQLLDHSSIQLSFPAHLWGT